MVMPSFLAALATLKMSDRILTLPESLARNFADAFGLKVFPLPLKLPKFEVSLIYHPRSERDPALSWFRENIRTLAREL
jgi:DNA-binding transcriptional LysR family regulator